MIGYWSLGKMRFIAGLQYRAAALAGVATQVFFGFIFIMVFIAFYQNSASPPPMALAMRRGEPPSDGTSQSVPCEAATGGE